MIKEFYLSFKSSGFDSQRIKHVQYNIVKRLRRLKYPSYKRIDMFIETKNTGSDNTIELEWDDGKTARIVCKVNKIDNNEISNKTFIADLYQAIVACFEVLWTKNGWDALDIVSLYKDIQDENFFVTLTYGKVVSSPKKTYNAEFVCDVYPDYADYFVHFTNTKSQHEAKVSFLKGLTIVELFFSFYNSCYWKDEQFFLLTDTNREIFFVFDANTNSFSIEYIPKYNSLEQCKKHVLAFHYDVSPGERKRLLGLPS